MSEQHAAFLKYCWPNVLSRSKLLREADVAVYLNPPDEERGAAEELLKDTFAAQDQNGNLKIYHRPKLGKTGGAHMAIYEAVTEGFFSGYDWIIRVNPDVLIRDDSFLLESMSDPSIRALLIRCLPTKTSTNTHTDFFAIRPEVLDAKTFPRRVRWAETGFTDSIKKSVLEKVGSYRWIMDSGPAKRGACRAGNGRDYYESSIVHDHTLHPDICQIPDDDVHAGANVTELLGTPWPEAWRPII